MKHRDFNIVFEKLDEARSEGATPQHLGELSPEASPDEIEEIAELRRMVLEVSEPAPTSFTTT